MRLSSTSGLAALVLGASAFAACGSPSRPGATDDMAGTPRDPRVTVSASTEDAGANAVRDAAADPRDARVADVDVADVTDGATAPIEPDGYVEPPPVPPAAGVCPPLAAVATLHARVLSLGADDIVLLGSVTPDGLTAAWSTLVGGVTSFFVADRASTTGTFGAPRAIPTAAGAAAFGKVALDAAGLRLVVVAADRRGFRELARPFRDSDFGEAAEGDFVAVNAAIAALPIERLAGDPVLSADGSTFVYTLFGGVHDARIHESIRTSTGFGEGDAHPELVTTPGARVSATGLAADGKALFFYDTGAGEQKAAFRGDPRAASRPAPFTFVRALGPRRGVQPSADCSEVYFAAPTATGSGGDLVVAPFAP